MSLGRRKIQMKMIQEKDARQVAFSKRRSGLFKKANELCTLTGCEIAILVFSPGGKPFSFGHPCMDTIMKRFLGRTPMPAAVADKPEAHLAVNSEINQHFNDLCEEVEAVKKRGENLKEMEMESHNFGWLEAPIDDLGLAELVKSKLLMEEFRNKITKRFEEISIPTPSPSPSVNSIGDIDLNVPNPDEMRASVHTWL